MRWSKDIDKNVVLNAIADMPQRFHTTDISNHTAVRETHRRFVGDFNYHAGFGSFLSRLASQRGIITLVSHGNNNALWQKTAAAAPSREHQRESDSGLSPSSVITARRPTGTVVRSGHYATLDYMASPAFREVKKLFESFSEIGGVYFRPTDKGVTVVDLDATSPKPRIGVGEDPYIACGTTAAQIAPTMPQRIAYLTEVRARQAGPSRENQFEARLIRAAQASHLRLPGFPEQLRFIHSQWRMDRAAGGTAQLTDLIAVDLPTSRLVLIELKAGEDYSAVQQVQQYLGYFQSNGSELRPFFARVAQVMGALYDCPELSALDVLGDPVEALASWPGSSGTPRVFMLD